MPRGDGTGPNGMGPMTGRAAGYCAGFVPPRTMGRGMRRGGGGLGGRGLGRRNQGRVFGPMGPQWAGTGFPADAAVEPMTREQELEVLRRQAANVEGALGDIRARIDALTTDNQED